MNPHGHRRSTALALAVLLALLAHLGLLQTVHESLRAVDLQTPAIQRAAVRFDRQLAPSTPVAVVAAPRPPAPRVARSAPVTAAAEPVVPAASDAASDVASDRAAGVADAASEVASLAASLAAASAASAAAVAASTAAEPAPATAEPALASAAVTPAAAPASAAAQRAGDDLGFDWPASTRLSYRLTGWYRGEVHGQAEVQWLRVGERGYQVHLSVSIGPAFAPLVTRRMSSEGRLTPGGLAPQRYEQLTTQIVGRDRQVSMAFEPAGIRLARGDRVAYRVDVQDTASQFIQIIYLLRTQADLVHKGSAMSFPLALPNRVDDWVYEVAETVVEPTPIGPLETLHVKPRRRAEGGNLTAQMWYAPALQMLPVRIRIDQDAETWVDLRLDRAPEQGG